MRGLAGTAPAAQLTPGPLPGLPGGPISLQGLIRRLAEPMANEVMSAGADRMCAGGGGRNGYRERKPTTCVGTLAPKAPRLRRGSFSPEDAPTRHQRTDRALRAHAREQRAEADERGDKAQVLPSPGAGSPYRRCHSRVG